MNIDNKNTEIILINKRRNQYYIDEKLRYEMGTYDLINEKNNTYIDEITKLIKSKVNLKLKHIYFNIQNEEIIIRNIENIRIKKTKEIVRLIKSEICDYILLDLENYVIKYKKIINTKGKADIQGILFPRKYVDMCNKISENLKIRKRYLYINFDILQKLLDLKLINVCKKDENKAIIIQNRKEDIILNTVINNNVMESYIVNKFNNKCLINDLSESKNTYYFGISDDFTKEMQIEKLDVKNKLKIKENEGIIDMTLDYLPVWGMIL